MFYSVSLTVSRVAVHFNGRAMIVSREYYVIEFTLTHAGKLSLWINY